MTSSASHLGSHFADAFAARRAIDLALPMIESVVQDPSVCGAGFLVIVVMDPGLTPDICGFDKAVLLEHCIGDRSRWDADYAAFARAKARLAWQHGMDSHSLQALQPHRLRRGDSLLWGSVHLHGIVVGVSGAEPWWDEAFAMAVAANLRAVAQAGHAAATKQHRLNAGSSFDDLIHHTGAATMQDPGSNDVRNSGAPAEQPARPGDEAAPGSAGTGEGRCRVCSGGT